MKKNTIYSVLFILLTIVVSGQEQDKTRALILIDIQNFYFPNGDAELVNPENASKNASLILENFRNNGEKVIHIRHNYDPGGEIHKDVSPSGNEKVISKDFANSFKNTDLLTTLTRSGVEELVIVGMQTHMCVEATTRAASDLGYDCIVISDACATKNLVFGEKKIDWEDVHYSTLATLNRTYAKVMTTQEWLEEEKKP